MSRLGGPPPGPRTGSFHLTGQLEQTELVATENYLQVARRYYNGSVRDYNTMTESVPSNIIAGQFNFEPKEFFQKSSDDAGNVPLVELGTVE